MTLVALFLRILWMKFAILQVSALANYNFLVSKVLSCSIVNSKYQMATIPMGGGTMPMQARSRYYPRLADAKLLLHLRLANR